jgi:hypothetical protein
VVGTVPPVRQNRPRRTAVSDRTDPPEVPRLDAESERKLREALGQDFHRPRTRDEWEALGGLLADGDLAEGGKHRR